MPTTVEELDALGVLGEQKLEEYGSRLVKTLKKFVADEGLEGHLKKRPKRSKLSGTNAANSSSSVSKASLGKTPKPRNEIIDLDNDDEFGGEGIDFSTIEISGQQTKGSKAISPHFR